ncbi:hypothetical protein ACJZ2D_015882 [Fusarium nematophilum]
MTFLGLHVGSDKADYVPSLCSENKRRLSSRIFTIDKVMVSFTGRPPLLGRRYFSTPLPLDIRDEDLLGDKETLDRAVRDLDEYGWNRNGELHSATLTRARVQIAIIRDELLEIALGNGSSATLTSLREIKAREERTVALFPSSLTHRPEDLDDSDLDIDTVYSRILVRLEHLQNLFFAERLLLRLGQPDEGRLLIISFEMVTLTLVFWTHQIDGVCRARRRHPLPRAPPPDIPRRAPRLPQVKPVDHSAEAEPADRLPRLGETADAERGPLRRLQGCYTGRSGS